MKVTNGTVSADVEYSRREILSIPWQRFIIYNTKASPSHLPATSWNRVVGNSCSRWSKFIGMPLTDFEYEDAYAEALRCLADDGHDVGVPSRDGEGRRYCTVDGRKLDDRGVLEAWWEPEITAEILEARSRSATG